MRWLLCLALLIGCSDVSQHRGKIVETGVEKELVHTVGRYVNRWDIQDRPYVDVKLSDGRVIRYNFELGDVGDSVIVPASNKKEE
jgi:hypothetical protein